MKRFSQLVILLFGFVVFLSPIGINLQPSAQHEEVVSSELLVSQKTAGISLEMNVAEAAFIKANCSGNWLTSPGCNFTTALLEFFEIIWFQTTQIIAAVMAIVVDFLLIHSISSSSYTSGLIEAGWEILRDFVNIVFIFALLIIAFNIVLDRQSANNKGKLLKTLLVALVLNFSLFVTYAVIDASNIFAHLFYDRIETTGNVYIEGDTTGGGENNAGQQLAEFFNGWSGVKSPSTAILSSFNPQKIINGARNDDGTVKNSIGAFESFLIIFFAGALNILIAYVFISVALLFLGRTVGLMLLGIFAPLAFGTLTLPGATNTKWVGFTSWWKQLLSLSFMAPIYLLLLYLTVTFATNKGVLGSIANVGGASDSVITLILSVVLPFALIAILLMTALKVTKSLAGELGGMIVDYAKKGIGGALAAGTIVATGGVAAAGVAARAGGGIARLAGKKELGRKLDFYGNKAMSFKSDITKVPGFSNLVGKNMSKNIGKVTGRSLLGHIDNFADKSNKEGVWGFGNEFEALEKKRQEAFLKDAKDSAEEAKRKAEAKHEAPLYQARIQEEKDKKDPAYIKAEEDLKKSMDDLAKAQKEENEARKKVKNMKAGDPFMAAAKADLASKEAITSRESLNVQRNESTYKSTAGYISEKKREKIEEDKKRDGETAVAASRKKSAEKVVDDDPQLANRILAGDNPKDKTMEKILEKLNENK